jgi:hypothetical protein
MADDRRTPAALIGRAGIGTFGLPRSAVSQAAPSIAGDAPIVAAAVTPPRCHPAARCVASPRAVGGRTPPAGARRTAA